MKGTSIAMMILALTSCVNLKPAERVSDVEVAYAAAVRIDVKIAVANGEGLPKIGNANGTGVSVGKDLVLTAGHICDVGSQLEVLAKRIAVTDTSGNTVVATVAKLDVDVDLCLLRLDSKLSTVPITVARMMPKKLSRIVYVGSPTGIMGGGDAAFIGEGRFIGYRLLKGDRFVPMSTLPATNGASGSGIVHGRELVGVLVSVNTAFHHVSFFVDTVRVRRFLGFEN